MSLEPITPDEAVELYLTDKQAELAQSTLYSHSSRLGHFTRWCAEEEIRNLNDLSGRDLHRYRLWRRVEGDLAPASEKGQMDTLRVFIRWCESLDAVPVDLSVKVVSPTLSDKEKSRDEMLDADVAEMILEKLSLYEFASPRHVCFVLMWHCLLRRGAVRALDFEDYDSGEMALEVRHRAETGTPIKNKHRGERYVALSPEVCTVLDAWLADRRPEATDEYERVPFLSTVHGRAHLTTIQSYAYSLTRPCEYTNECPHHRSISSCDAAQMRSAAHGCPSSVSPHCIRRGAITHWLSSDVPDSVVSERANVSIGVIEDHYDRRTERKKMEQRRRYLSQV